MCVVVSMSPGITRCVPERTRYFTLLVDIFFFFSCGSSGCFWCVLLSFTCCSLVRCTPFMRAADELVAPYIPP